MNFNIVNEENKFKMGYVISVFKLPDSDQEIVLFSSEDFEDDMCSLEIAYLNTNNDGYDYVTEIEDKEVFKKAIEVVKDMMGVINNG